MTPNQFRNSLYTAVARKNGLTEVRVGIRLEAITRIDSDKEEDIEAAKEQGKDNVTEGVYGGRREELRALLNNLLRVSHSNSEFEMDEYIAAQNKLIEFQKTL